MLFVPGAFFAEMHVESRKQTKIQMYTGRTLVDPHLFLGWGGGGTYPAFRTLEWGPFSSTALILIVF